MSVTTIDVSPEVRDALKRQAAAHGRTLGEHLQALVGAEEREMRWRELRRAMASYPANAEYEEELCDWQSDAWN